MLQMTVSNASAMRSTDAVTSSGGRLRDVIVTAPFPVPSVFYMNYDHEYNHAAAQGAVVALLARIHAPQAALITMPFLQVIWRCLIHPPVKKGYVARQRVDVLQQPPDSGMPPWVPVLQQRSVRLSMTYQQHGPKKADAAPRVQNCGGAAHPLA